MTAAEARKKAQEVEEAKDTIGTGALSIILEGIEGLANEGKFQLVLDEILHPSVIDILKAEPYKYSVETSIEKCIGGARTTTISW